MPAFSASRSSASIKMHDQKKGRARTRVASARSPFFDVPTVRPSAPLVLVEPDALPVAVPLPVADELGIGRVLVTTALVLLTLTVAVPTSTVKYMPATGPSKPELLT